MPGTTAISALPDAELVARCRGGDGTAWSELVHRYARYVNAILTRAYRLGPSDAEDVFQEVFVRVYERLGELRDASALRPWIAQLTRRLAVDRLRQTRPTDLGWEVPERGEPDAELARIEEAMTVRDALAGLPDHCQEVLDRFFARDESYRTIGDALGIPVGTVASRIARCLSRLRDALPQGG